MHIQLITPYYYPEVCATSYLYQELCQSFHDLGHDVVVITGYPRYSIKNIPEKYRNTLWLRETFEGVDVLRIKTAKLPRNIPVARGVEYLCIAVVLFLRALFSKRPDIVLVHPAALFEGLSAMCLHFLKKTPFVLNVHDLFPQTAIDLGLLTNKALIRFFRKLEKFLYKKANWVTIHSPGNREWALAHGANPDRSTVMPIWMDSKRLHPGPSENPWRQRHGLTKKFAVIFAGTQGYNQDMQVILNAADRLNSYQDIQFVIIGDGVQHSEMVKRSKEMGLSNLMWLDWQPREQYSMIMHTADVVLATLKKEVSTPVVPSKILSAMSAGRPLITCMPLEGDAPKLVLEAQAGIALQPGDDSGLAKSILKLHNDRSLVKKFGTNGRQYVEKHRDVNLWAKRYIELFSSLIEKG